MISPFTTGQRVCIADHMVLVYGFVTDPSMDLGNGDWGVWVKIPQEQPGFEDFFRDSKLFLGEVDVAYEDGVLKGYTGCGLFDQPDADGNLEIFIVPDY